MKKTYFNNQTANNGVIKFITFKTQKVSSKNISYYSFNEMA